MLRSAVFALSVALTAAACGTAPSTTASAPLPSVAVPANATHVTLSDFQIEIPSSVVTGLPFAVHNAGPTPHNLTINDAAGKFMAASTTISPPGDDVVVIDLQPGTYTVLCSLPGHASLGMRGTFTVTAH